MDGYIKFIAIMSLIMVVCASLTNYLSDKKSYELYYSGIYFILYCILLEIHSKKTL